LADLSVDLRDLAELDADDWQIWSDMVAANPRLTSPYFRPAYARMAAEVCPGAAVAVFRRGARTVGFFPYQTRWGVVQPLSAPMSDYHGVISRPEETPGLAEVADLMPGDRLKVPAWVGPAEAGHPREMMMSTLPEAGFDDWYDGQRLTFGKYFKDKERARRSMEAELGPLRVEIGMKDPALLDHLIELKREQYRRSRMHDIFACGWTRDLLLRLMQAPDGDVSGSLAALWAGDRLCALEYSMHAGQHYHFWFPAYEPSLARCSPGILLTLDTMKQASDQGYRVFDFGFGGETYKKYFCNTSMDVREAVIRKPSLNNAAVAAISQLLALAGEDRSQRLRTSVRRRWGAIEACETENVALLRGVLAAMTAALAKSVAKSGAGPSKAQPKAPPSAQPKAA
jgi:Protein involved in cellulose biosynthesis (CelD)